MNTFERYNPKPVGDDVDKWTGIMDENWKQLEGIDKRAKKAGKVLGRIVQVGYADGAAVYQVVKVTKRTATVQVCRQIGDDWVLPMWGERSTVPLTQVTRFLF